MPRVRMARPRVATLDLTRKEPKVADRFYASPEWQRARSICLITYGFRCAHCGRSGGRLQVDHIVELKDGGAEFAQDNLQPLCGACHTLKTNQVRNGRNGNR